MRQPPDLVIGRCGEGAGCGSDRASGCGSDHASDLASDLAFDPASGLASDAARHSAVEPAPQLTSTHTPAPNPETRAAELAAFLDSVRAQPYRYDFFQTMRRIEALSPHQPRFGRAKRPADEAVRLAQHVSLAFAPGSIAALSPADAHGPPRVAQNFFGYLGPNGPLPLHLTDFARERILHAGDHTFARLLDMLLHRFLLLFYRAWSQARPATQMDRPREDRFAAYVGSLIGLVDPGVLARDAASHHAKLHFAGLSNQQTRPAEALQAICADVLGVQARVEPFVGQWLTIAPDERTRLASSAARSGAPLAASPLGGGAVLGPRVWDRQHKFRLHLGPLTLAQYEALLPGGARIDTLAALVRHQTNREFAWDAKLVLRANEVPTLRLGCAGRLGYTSWLKCERREHDAADLALPVDSLAALPGQ